MAVQKGKQGTKGAKQIVEENISTLSFYRNMGLGSCLLYFAIMLILFSDSFSATIIFMNIICIVAYIGGYQFMVFMARTQYTETGVLIDSGLDLNLEGGIAEHVKDLIILTAGTQLLSLISNYFWLIFLLVPLRAFQMLWSSVLKPWFFQRNEQPEEINEKKQKKLERKMKRMK
ncbi:transmembrane protein 208 [Ctenocephalides felis]|uniref:transmembrane protein 208 n=1 Tax=Ctenocephalides felis TaxID=7515 RepID=UPI000E6E2C3D|nr:transmembrane protein 208 [Ctenocephalides felis]